MINSLELTNFKSFCKTQTIKCSPITLIYGPNSSGKSSIIQSLMMIQQTVLAKDANSRLVTSGDSINLSKFNNLVHGVNLDLSMKFLFEYTHNYDSEEFFLENNYKNLFGNKQKRKVQFEFDAYEDTSKLKTYEFSVKRKGYEDFFYSMIRSKVDLGKNTSYIIKALDSEPLKSYLYKKYDLDSTSKEGFEFIKSEMESKFISNYNLNLPSLPIDQSSELSSYIYKVNNDVRDLFQKFKYLGPLRSSPKSIYTSEISHYQKGKGKHNLGVDIYNGGEELIDKINYYFRVFNIPYYLSVVNLGDTSSGDIISIKLKDLRNNTIVGPTDVGFGIGQVLPIILESVICKNKIICVEQPEIHLHPRLQANLADLFIDSVNTENNNQWFIETHSEALMLRIQKRIRNGEIPANLVSFIYVDVGEEGASVTQLPIDDEGDFTVHWPNDFFEERLKEMGR